MGRVIGFFVGPIGHADPLSFRLTPHCLRGPWAQPQPFSPDNRVACLLISADRPLKKGRIEGRKQFLCGWAQA
jgi:hypothetical protein